MVPELAANFEQRLFVSNAFEITDICDHPLKQRTILTVFTGQLRRPASRDECLSQ